MSTVMKLPLLPDEISAAARTISSSYRDAAPHRAMRSRYLSFYLWVFCVGAWVGLGLQMVGAVSASSVDFWRGGLAVLAALTGFMITTISFTGKAEAAKSLTLEQMQIFAGKSNHLLFSQLLTLFNHIAGLIVLAAILLVPGSSLLSETLITIVFALLLTSVLRSLLVPVQIIELHRFAHAALVEEKRVEREKASRGI